MGKHLDWLIAELKRHGKDRLPTEETKILLQEVRTHIEEGVQARMDLGLSAEQAEKETVEAFGDPEKIVRELSRSGKRKYGFLFEKGVTAGGGPLLVAGFGSIRVKGLEKQTEDGV